MIESHAKAVSTISFFACISRNFDPVELWSSSNDRIEISRLVTFRFACIFNRENLVLLVPYRPFGENTCIYISRIFLVQWISVTVVDKVTFWWIFGPCKNHFRFGHSIKTILFEVPTLISGTARSNKSSYTNNDNYISSIMTHRLWVIDYLNTV